MRPAFATIRHAAAFTLLLLVLIAAPAVTARFGLLDRAQVYETMPAGTGPVRHIQQQIFERSEDLDMVFVGSSLMWSAIDAPYVQQALSSALGRPASVEVLASVWPGLDRDYAFLRDLLAHRRVGLAVIQLPHRNRPTRDFAAEINRVSDQPHVQAFRFYRVGEFDEVLDGLSQRNRLALYAGAVLGLPRHLLTKLRPNYLSPSPVEETLGARFQREGFYGAAFEPFRPEPPVIPADEMIYSADGAQSYRFFDEPLPPYQHHFARLIAELLSENDVPAVLLHIPQANEIDAGFVEERENWPATTGIKATMVGVPPARMFQAFSADETERFFLNDHLNENGAIYFTKFVMPALLRTYQDLAQTD